MLCRGVWRTPGTACEPSSPLPIAVVTTRARATRPYENTRSRGRIPRYALQKIELRHSHGFDGIDAQMGYRFPVTLYRRLCAILTNRLDIRLLEPALLINRGVGSALQELL